MNEPLKPDETILCGNWIREGNRTVADIAEQRIKYLTGNVLRRIAARESGWTVLYQDLNDGRYWEMTFPHSEMHGGGPRTLTWLPDDDAKRLFDLKY